MADQTEADRDPIDPDDYWVWDPDAKNDLDSMVGGLMVLIDADDLRDLSALPAKEQRAAYDRGMYDGRQITPRLQALPRTPVRDRVGAALVTAIAMLVLFLLWG